MNVAELALAACRLVDLTWICGGASARQQQWLRLHGDEALASWLAPQQATHFYFGSEFCEFLLPSCTGLRQALAAAADAGLRLVLLTPIASPAMLPALEELLALLPQGSEVVVNDWGVARLLATDYPYLQPVGGRLLCRMTKDPRLDERWAGHCQLNVGAPTMLALFERLGIRRVELDLPLFAQEDTFDQLPLPVGVHLPYLYVAKGRMCRIGGLAKSGAERFAVGRRCQKECLRVSATAWRAGREQERAPVQVGNTLFSRHSPAAAAVLRTASDRGKLARLIVSAEAV